MVTPPNVLVVGDAETVRQHASSMAGDGSFRLIAVDPAGALAAIRDADVDVVVVDLTAEGGSGVDLARRVRRAAHDLPMVMLAASRSADVAMESMRVGAIDCLLKPYDPVELVAAVNRAVEWRSAVGHSRGLAARLEPEMRGRSAALVESSLRSAIGSPAALDAWLTMVYRKDVAVLEHVRRVARIATAIATTLELDPATIEPIFCAALLHDVGKVAIPGDIMNRPGPLSAYERELARRHVQIAADIASANAFLRPCADMLLASRERYDGSGYPRKLRVTGIPIGARVIAVAEAYDTLTMGMAPFEPGASAAANAEIVRAAGSRFDPVVVRAWLRYVDAVVDGGDAGAECAL